MSTATGSGTGEAPGAGLATRTGLRRTFGAVALIALCTLALLGLCAAPTGAQSATRAAPAPAQRAAATTTVILVRHAEKAAQPAADPPLTAEGTARARALVDVARAAGVTTIITTPFARTRATAGPLAAALGISPDEVNPHAPDHAARVAALIRTKHAGEVVLVVGHSNTIPKIVEALGAGAQREICDGEYDDLYIVSLPASGKTRLIHARYGDASPRGAGCSSMR